MDLTSEVINANMPNKISKKKLKFNIKKRYIIRLCLYLSLTLAYYLVVHVYLYPLCEIMLTERPKTLFGYITRRTLIPQINFWARETSLYESDIAIQRIIPDSLLFAYPRTEFEDKIKALRVANIDMRKSLEYLNDDLKIRLFESDGSNNTRYGFGSFPVTNILLIDAYDSLDFGYTDLNETLALTAYFTELQTRMKKNFDLVNQSSNDNITEKLNSILYSIILYCLLTSMVYFLYYLPYLSSEIKKLYNLQTIISIIPKKCL